MKSPVCIHEEGKVHGYIAYFPNYPYLLLCSLASTNRHTDIYAMATDLWLHLWSVRPHFSEVNLNLDTFFTFICLLYY